MKVTFNIQNKKTERSIIILSVHWDGMRYQVSTGQSVAAKSWDDSKKRVKSSYLNAMEVNRFLEHLKVSVTRKYMDLKVLEKSLSKDELKKFIKELISPSKKKSANNPKPRKKKSFSDYFDFFINSREKNHIVKPRTILKYKAARGHILAFEKYIAKKLFFGDINSNFNEHFMAFLNHHRKLNNNTASSVVRIVKTFMHWAKDKKYHSNNTFVKDLKTPSKDGKREALTSEELKLLENVELTSNKLIKTKDLFLLQIHTGLRYSDLNNLKPENFDLENKLIKLHMPKTEEPLKVPLVEKIMYILAKYPDLNLPKISNQKYNDNIKELCKIAGIDKPTPSVDYFGTEKEEKTVPKYKLISSHTARSTFITLMLKKNLPPEMIMKVSGHKSRRSFQKYVKIAQDEAIEAVRNAWG